MELKFTSNHTYIPVDATRRENGATSTYAALDKEYGREIFIKEILIEGGNARAKENNLRKAMLEVKAMMKAEEATCFIPRIYETFYDDKTGKLYIVMQLIKGKSLREYMRTASPLMMADWMIALCDILSVLEQRHLQNKDVKPENIIITPSKLLFLIDFDISISAPKRNVGTKCYRAPEMIKREDIHEASRNKVDIFAVGVMLYEFFAGSVPQEDGSDYDVSPFGDRKEWDVFVSPKEKNPDVPDAVNDIAIKCMKLRPEDRYANAAALKRALMDAKRDIKAMKNRR